MKKTLFKIACTASAVCNGGLAIFMVLGGFGSPSDVLLHASFALLMLAYVFE